MSFNVVVADFKQEHKIPIASDDRSVAIAAAVAIREAITAGYATVKCSAMSDNDPIAVVLSDDRSDRARHLIDAYRRCAGLSDDVAAATEIIADLLEHVGASGVDQKSAVELVDSTLESARAAWFREGSLRSITSA